MTPLEHKQIQIEATRDVLFEQGTKSSKVDEAGEDGESAKKRKHKTKSKDKGRGKKGQEATEADEEDVRIEGLSYKVLPNATLTIFPF